MPRLAASRTIPIASADEMSTLPLRLLAACSPSPSNKGGVSGLCQALERSKETVSILTMVRSARSSMATYRMDRARGGLFACASAERRTRLASTIANPANRLAVHRETERVLLVTPGQNLGHQGVPARLVHPFLSQDGVDDAVCRQRSSQTSLFCCNAVLVPQDIADAEPSLRTKPASRRTARWWRAYVGLVPAWLRNRM